MDKTKLKEILSTPYTLESWQNVLIDVFGVRNLLQQPQQITLHSNNRAVAAFELGSFSTTDDRIIGIYQVNVMPRVWLERNKVGLRELLRNIYKYDVDGALVVFVQDDKWRLSFISEVRTLNEDGEFVKNFTEPKRYTYLLGRGEKTKTPTDRLFFIANKPQTLEDIRSAFSVEALNQEFYNIVAEHFYQLVGATTGKGTKLKKYDPQLQLPRVPKNDVKNYQEFAVRLIGRTIFCWFLKVKKSEADISLLPERLLSSKAVKQNPGYYNLILEKVFFETLNTPMDKRISNLPEGCEQIPFLNGGLFDAHLDDCYESNQTVSHSENVDSLKIPDHWFLSFFEELEKYNFTIDENSTVDIEVSVDPEMLGRIFENLLAEIDPDSGETARKATGSFYTPREIVDYMATESLVHYLHNQTGIEKDLLETLFKIDQVIPSDSRLSEYRTSLLDAIDSLKILDPACGSGAFPMGVLQKILIALQKLDPRSNWWKSKQINKIENPILRKQIKEKLETASVEYALKLGIIQNTLYGVDVQPVASDISKLRCFLTLIVDECIDETKVNRGVEPLPNLEFKFVTADTLLKLPEEKHFGGLFNSNDDLEELKSIRLAYLQSYGKQKKDLKQEFKRIQIKIANEQSHSGAIDPKSRAYLISTWNPFQNQKTDWFDTLWMFGVKDFDIVIGNPPYVLLQNTSMSKLEQEHLRKAYESAQYKTDLFHLFIEHGISLANKNKGILCYITPNTFLKNKHNNILRKILIRETHLLKIIRFSVPIFKNASVDNSIIISENSKTSKNEIISVIDITNTPFDIENQSVVKVNQNSIKPDSYLFDFDIADNKFIPLIREFPKLKDFARAYFGIQTFERNKFVSKYKLNDNYFPVVDGANISRYFLKENTEYICFQPDAIKSGGNSEVYKKDRILVRQIGNYPEGCFCPSGIYTLNTIYNIFVTCSDLHLKYILAIINSKLIKAYWLKTSFDNKKTFPKIKKEPIESIPIVKANSRTQQLFIILVDYIIFLKSLPINQSINEFVPNSHIVLVFEDIIDALVYELYFEEEFYRVNIAFMIYAERDFESIENTIEEKDKIEIIKTVYQKLRERNNEIRQNLKLIDTRLSDLIMPIKSAK